MKHRAEQQVVRRTFTSVFVAKVCSHFSCFDILFTRKRGVRVNFAVVGVDDAITLWLGVCFDNDELCCAGPSDEELSRSTGTLFSVTSCLMDGRDISLESLGYQLDAESVPLLLSALLLDELDEEAITFDLQIEGRRVTKASTLMRMGEDYWMSRHLTR